ncbi:MAG: replication-associated recombination protein A [Deltaproteobacteria bacterium]|jgi:putative ATPase|nr:replication-associated recombination protein A [Deltaproteobacteria bacterium]
MDLFDDAAGQKSNVQRPLADRMRPKNLDGFVGQSHILAGGGLIRRAIEEDRPFSMIFWGPPGCGKTSLAMIIARETDAYFVSFSAVLAGVKEIRAVICEATKQRNLYQRRSILFVDEIHRFNKAQQDAFLHHVESGLITLIGATTENPSFEVIPPLLSRTRVILLHPFTDQELILILEYAIRDTENGLGRISLSIHKDVIAYIAMTADGDARTALNNLQLIVDVVEPGSSNIRKIDLETAEKALFKKALRYDKNGEEHYNLISALHKSLRGSDPDAALYWMQRMLAAGEDPLYVARRMVRFASEDIGIADPQALVIALAAMEAFRFLGPPEGELALAQAAAYLATAPKSNAIYTAHKKIKETIKKTGYLPVPLHIRNAPTKLTKEIGYGKGYKYAHDFRDAYAAQAYLPEALGDRVFFRPTERGFEKTVKKRLEDWKKRACHDPDREPEQAL